jgi:hypothetical protein
MAKRKSTRKWVNYPDIKKVNDRSQTNKNLMGRPSTKEKQNDITDLIGYDILEPFFREQAEQREVNYNIMREKTKEKTRIKKREWFLDQLDEEMKAKFFKFVEEYNRLVEKEDYTMACKVKRRFQCKLSYFFNKDKYVLRTQKIAESLKECTHVECNLCNMILENNPIQKRKHSKYHSTAQRDGRNTTQNGSHLKAKKKVRAMHNEV